MSLPTSGAARATDPQTSHDAAESMAGEVLEGEQKQVMDALRLLLDFGQPTTAGRVTRVLGNRQRNCVARRLTDLAEGGYIVKAGTHREDRKGARTETVWKVVSS